MSRVLEINDPDELANYRLTWNALLGQTRNATFFQTWDWLDCYWRHFGEDQRLRVLVVYACDGPIGILPLVVHTEKRRFTRLRVLGYPLADWGSFYAPIGPNPTATLLAGLGHVRRTRADWDLVELAWVDRARLDRGRTPLAMANAGLTASAEPWQTASLVDLESFGTWERYWQSRTSRWRNNVRRSEKKLSERGEIAYVRYRPGGAACDDGDPRWDLYDECERIAEESWQAASHTGTTLSHAAIRPFLRDCHEVAAHAGGLDLNLLLVDGRPVAFNYAYTYAGYVFGLRTGFDPDVQEGAGSILQARMIADSFERGDRTYDLGTGYGECKRHWTTEHVESWRYTHFRQGMPMAQLVRAKRGWERFWERRRRPASQRRATGRT